MNDDNNFYSEYNQNDDKYSFSDYTNRLTITETNIGVAKSFLWMFIAMLVTMLTGKLISVIAISPDGYISEAFVFILFAAIIGQLITSFAISKESLVKKDFASSLALLMLYAVLEGLTFSILFIYLGASILYRVFLIVSMYFLLLAGFTFLFRKKLNGIERFAAVGLLTLFVSSIFAFIYGLFFVGLNSEFWLMYIGISIFALIVYSVITIADIKNMAVVIGNNESKNAASVAAAFMIYLDFLIIFKYILRILILFGGGRSKK